MLFKNGRRLPHLGNSFLACLFSWCLSFPWSVLAGEWLVGHGSVLSWSISHRQWLSPLRLPHEKAGGFCGRSRLCLRAITLDMAWGIYKVSLTLFFSNGHRPNPTAI